MINKQVFILVGQKGSGKSFLGQIFQREFDIKFIRVEDWAKQIRKGRAIEDDSYIKDVFTEIEKGIRAALNKTDKLVFESTGLTRYFDLMLESLKNDFLVKTIYVHADSKTCLKRVKSRDQTIHINVSDDQVLTINKKVRERNFESDYMIHNENKTEKELTSEIQMIIGQQ